MSAEIRQSTREKLVKLLRQTPDERIAEAEAKLAAHRAERAQEGKPASSCDDLMEDILEMDLLMAQTSKRINDRMAGLSAEIIAKVAELKPANFESVCPPALAPPSVTKESVLNAKLTSLVLTKPDPERLEAEGREYARHALEAYARATAGENLETVVLPLFTPGFGIVGHSTCTVEIERGKASAS